MSYQPPFQTHPAPVPQPPLPCPFCGGTNDTQLCRWCGRDTTAPRRPCTNCGRMALTYEPACWNCGKRFQNDLSWKIPLIIAIFVLAIVLSILIRGIR